MRNCLYQNVVKQKLGPLIQNANSYQAGIIGAILILKRVWEFEELTFNLLSLS
jgi:hypothetical protein